MFCKRCGAELKEDARFCSSCGAGAGDEAAGAAASAPKKRRVWPVIVIACSAALILAAVLLIVLLPGSSPEKKADNLLEDIARLSAEGEYEEVLLCWEEYIELLPADPRGYVGLSRVYIKLNRIDRSIDALETGLAATDGAQEVVEEFIALLSPYGEVTTDDEWIYFTDPETDELWRINKKGEKERAEKLYTPDPNDFYNLSLANAAWIFRSCYDTEGGFYTCDADGNGLNELYLGAESSIVRCAYENGELRLYLQEHHGAAGNAQIGMLNGEDRPTLFFSYSSAGTGYSSFSHSAGLRESEEFFSSWYEYSEFNSDEYECEVNGESVSWDVYWEMQPELLPLPDNSSALLNYSVLVPEGRFEDCMDAYTAHTPPLSSLFADIDGDGEDEGLFAYTVSSACGAAFGAAECNTGSDNFIDSLYAPYYEELYLSERSSMFDFTLVTVADREGESVLFKTVLLPAGSENSLGNGALSFSDGSLAISLSGQQYPLVYSAEENNFDSPCLWLGY